MTDQTDPAVIHNGDPDPGDLTGYIEPDPPIGCLNLAAGPDPDDWPSRRTGLRDQIAAAIWERQNPGRRYADCEHPWQADAEADADAVLTVLYREWPWLQAEAEDASDTASDRPQLPGSAREHAYLSTGCFHGDHAYCQSMTGLNGAKRPASCKFCSASCQCGCHDGKAATEATDGQPCTCGGRFPIHHLHADRHEVAEPDDPELTAEEARALADELSTDLYRAQDALAFVEECCVIADREGSPVTTARVRKWLKGAQCGRQLAADSGFVVDPTAPPLEFVTWSGPVVPRFTYRPVTPEMERAATARAEQAAADSERSAAWFAATGGVLGIPADGTEESSQTTSDNSPTSEDVADNPTATEATDAWKEPAHPRPCTATIEGRATPGGRQVQCTREARHPENHVGPKLGANGRVLWTDHQPGATPHKEQP